MRTPLKIRLFYGNEADKFASPPGQVHFLTEVQGPSGEVQRLLVSWPESEFGEGVRCLLNVINDADLTIRRLAGRPSGMLGRGQVTSIDALENIATIRLDDGHGIHLGEVVEVSMQGTTKDQDEQADD